MAKAPAGLSQLKHSYESQEMYGDNYGYRSSLNQTMVDHPSQSHKAARRFSPSEWGCCFGHWK